MRSHSLVFLFAVLAALPTKTRAQSPPLKADIVVLGGTSAGVVASNAAAKLGHSVILVAQGGPLGGLSASGLGATDIGNKAAIGGMARKFYQSLRSYYAKDDAWSFQERSEFRGWRKNEDALWYFEPKVAQSLFEAMTRASKLRVLRESSLDRGHELLLRDGHIPYLPLKDGRRVIGKVYIDATYEGDLMALADVSFTVGRESNAQYGESLNGVQTQQAVYHQFVAAVDPYRIKGDPNSGLLPFISPNAPAADGTGDNKVQAYCFRLCLTDVPENRVPFAKPEGYRAIDYELLLRHFEAGAKQLPWNGIGMPNGKTDTNNNRAFSTDAIGLSHSWPEASDAKRMDLYQRHKHYQQGLLWTLANHPRVPQAIRSEAARFGLAKDEFLSTGHWPPLLYVREGRRMVSDLVMTESHCRGLSLAKEPIGLAAYTMDSHNVQRYVDAHGHARNEGDVQVPATSPYPIGYRAIIPKRGECNNLLVPVALSASHIAFGSIRMEPVFMILGQSAATAASLSLTRNESLHDLSYPHLKEALLAADQVLEWTGSKPPKGIDPKSLQGAVFDDTEAKRTGAWVHSTSGHPFVGSGYSHDGNTAQGRKSLRFNLGTKISSSGKYELRIAYTSHANRATNTRIEVTHRHGTSVLHLNQQRPAPQDQIWKPLGTYEFAPNSGRVEVSNEGANGYVIVDALQLTPAS